MSQTEMKKMFLGITRCPGCILVIMCGIVLELSLSQDCSLEKMEGVIVDMKLSLSKGIRGTEPIYTATRDACINVCCLEKDIAGDRPCNLVIYDARRVSSYPNCYLFYCPSKEACPMKPLVGLVSYKITRDSGTTPFSNNRSVLAHSDLKGHSLSSLDAPSDTPNLTTPLNHTAAFQKTITSKMFELIDRIEEHLDKIDSHSEFPDDQMKDHSRGLGSSPRQNKTNLLPPSVATTVQHIALTVLPPTSSAPSTTIPQMPTTTVTTTMSTTTGHVTVDSRTTTLTARQGITTTAKQKITTTTTSRATASNTSSSSYSIVVPPNSVSSASLQKDHQNNGKLDSEASLSDGAPRKKHVPEFGDRSGLIAALLFGVVFLLLAIALVGRRVSETLQRRRYTKLDYLINGIYADV
uniref:MANSC domain containing 1 n=1 Tax=Sphenodon punctatus TaxID=8508 RepID=A0A8D0LC72_SPHPU